MNTNYGETWEPLLGVDGGWDIDINSDNHLYVMTWFNTVYRSTDDGENWEQVLQVNNTISNLFISTSDDIYVSEQSIGIHRSTDNGASWNLINSGLINYSNYGMTEDFEGYLYVSTWGDGVFKSMEPVVTVEDNNIELSNYKLKQNYPNPFNPITTIKYQIPELSFVTLKVYDVLGSEIQLL